MNLAGLSGGGVRAVAMVSALSAATVTPASAQWVQAYEQFYLPAEHNWAFRNSYRTADRLFNAFDYGHAILYETLYTRPDAPPERLEEKEYDFLTDKVLVDPPHVPLEEAAIEVAYAKIAPEAKLMFEWAHILHRQIYDVWADETIPPEQKDAAVAELLRYYKSRPEIAFSTVPKSMELMEGQHYSLAFRQRYPKFNGLIWAYHWLQVGLYEPLLTGKTQDDRQTGVTATVARFWQLLENPPANMPRLMPMTAAVAPAFARRYPEAAIIFDNLHAMHDVISDILASPEVPRGRKRAEILTAAARYRDATSFAMTEREWREMARMMGAHNMGGVAGRALTELPEPTVALGATHAQAMAHAGRAGMAHHDTSDSGAVHHPRERELAVEDGSEATRDSLIAMEHGAMESQPPSDEAAPSHHGGQTDGPVMDAHMRQMIELYTRMLADPVIRRRVMADTAMRRMLRSTMEHMPAEHRRKMEELMTEARSKTPAAAERDSLPGTHHHDPGSTR